MPDRPLDRVQSAVTVAQPAAIGPWQPDDQKDPPRKDRRRAAKRKSIEETLEQEQAVRDGAAADNAYHIDYHA